VASLLVATSAVALGGAMAGAGVTWTGLGTTNNWSDGANWGGGVAPSPGAAVVFDGQTHLNTVQDFPGGIDVGSIRFGTIAGDFNIDGQAIGIQSNGFVQMNAGQTAVIGSELRLAGPTMLASNALENQNGLALKNVSGSGGITVQGVRGAGGLTVDVVIGSASYTGTTTVTSGSLRVGGFARVSPYGELLTGTTTNQGDYTINPNAVLSGSGTIGLHAGGKVTLNGGVISPGVGALAPDTAPLTIHADLVFGDSSSFRAEGASGVCDHVTVDGLLDLRGVHDHLFTLVSGGTSGMASYVLMHYQMRLGAFDSVQNMPANAQLIYTSAEGAGPGQVIIVVPEAASGASAAIFTAVSVTVRRTRQRSGPKVLTDHR
jgi:fibronectin-binding autotransporter adhesin